MNGRKKKLLTDIVMLLTIILGVVAGYIRSQELIYAYDSSGLPISGHPISLILIVLSILASFIFFAVCRSAVEPGTGSYFDYFASSKFISIVAIISTLLLLLASLLQIVEVIGDSDKKFELFVHCFAVLTAICLIIQGILGISGRDSSVSPFLAVVPVFYGCFRLVYMFKGWSADPSIIDYIYKLTSVIMLTLAFYLACGFFFDKPRIRSTAVLSLLGFYFSIIAIFEGGSLADILTYQFGTIYMLSLYAQIIVKQNNDLNAKGSGDAGELEEPEQGV